MMIVIIGMLFLPVLFRLAIRLRLGLPMLYALLMLTAFHSWYQAHTTLADGIFFALVGLVILSWIVTLIRRLCNIAADWWSERAAAELFAYHVRQARANGETVVSTDGLWF